MLRAVNENASNAVRVRRQRVTQAGLTPIIDDLGLGVPFLN